jgi:putative ABC transport system permease protein
VHATNATLEEILGTTPLANTVLLAIEPGHEDEVIARLRRQPMVAGIVRKDAVIEQFREQSSGQMFIFTLVFIISTTVIVVGVVYNNARVTLSMKERELASMRVLGFTRAEISLVLIGELAVHVALAIPLGLWLGTLWSEGIAGMSDPEQYRLPVMISARTYAFSTVVALAAAIVSALLVRRKLYRLDLTAVLKSRE